MKPCRFSRRASGSRARFVRSDRAELAEVWRRSSGRPGPAWPRSTPLESPSAPRHHHRLPSRISPNVLAGGDEWQFRLIGLLSGVGLVLGAWWLARGIAGPVAGVLAAAAVYVAPYAQRESALFLTDVPAAALLLWAMGLLWRELELNPRPGRGRVLAATLGAVAFFMRYGSTTALAPMAITSLPLWWRRILTYWRVVVVAVAVLAAAWRTSSSRRWRSSTRAPVTCSPAYGGSRPEHHSVEGTASV